jgi:hypothetical protein
LDVTILASRAKYYLELFDGIGIILIILLIRVSLSSILD